MREVDGIKLYTRLEVAEMLEITPKTFKNYCITFDIRPIRIGRFIYYTEKQIREILKGRIRNAEQRKETPTLPMEKLRGRPRKTSAAADI